MRAFFAVIFAAFFAALFTLIPISSAFAGHAEGNGADLESPEQTSAWFLGTQTVNYCLVVAPNFGVPASDVLATVQTALANWQTYIDAKTDPQLRSNPRSILLGKGLARDYRLSGEL